VLLLLLLLLLALNDCFSLKKKNAWYSDFSRQPAYDHAKEGLQAVDFRRSEAAAAGYGNFLFLVRSAVESISVEA